MDILSAGRRPFDRVLAHVPLQLSRNAWLIAGLTLTGAILRVYLLADKSIWLDEAFSIALSQHDFGELLRLTVVTDAHPPFYYLVLKAWTVLGHGEGIVRLLSALLGAISIPLMYLVGAALYDRARDAGLLSATILTFSPFHIWYAQEARMYAMLTFLVLASAFFFIRALRDNEVKDWVGYALATALALYTDNGAIWYVLAIVCFSVLSRRRFQGRARNWILSHVVIALLYAPWLPSLYRQTQQVTESFWLAPPSFATVLETFLDFNSLNFPIVALSVLYMTVIFLWAYLVPGGGWQRRLASMWLFVPLLASLLLSLRQPIFLSRNLIVASLGYYLLIVDTIRKFDSRRATAFLLAPLLLMNLVSIGMNAWVEEKEDWRGLVTDVANHAAAQTEARRGESLILFVPSYAELPFAYYFDGYGLDVETQGYPQDELLLHSDADEVGSLETLLADRPVVWLVLRDVETVDPQWEVKAWLDGHGFVRGAELSGDEVSALTYIRWDLVGDGARPATSAAAENRFQVYVPLVKRGAEMTPDPAPTPLVHVVVRGDTIWELARRYGSSVEAIMEANGLSSASRLSVGQQLVIPVAQ